MNFSSDANANFEGLPDANQEICMLQTAKKGLAKRAAKLCGVALEQSAIIAQQSRLLIQ